MRLMSQAIALLYQDAHVVVVDKPSGLAVHRGWAAERDVVMTRVRDALGTWVYPVHRLDRGASGVLLFALHPAAARVLCDDFAAGRVSKHYLALVRGVPAPRLTIDHPVPRDEHGSERVPAVSEVERLEVLGRYSLVAVQPRTGRLHQIRRHLKHISCPLIGDVRYGKGEHNRLFRDRYDLHRLFLHATEIAFRHPAHGEPMTVRAPLGADLLAPLERLRRDHPHVAPQAK
jgi:tRNA pseudouridine65 synthase